MFSTVPQQVGSSSLAHENLLNPLNVKMLAER
jgi:hypothetical protein